MKVIFLLLNIHLVLGQAPGDFQQICRTDFRYRPLHDWIPYVNDTTVGVRGHVKWQILVDQNDYQRILKTGVGSSPVWTGRDVDGDGKQIVSSGTICTNSLQIRDTFTNSDSNNWVFTQSISYLDAIEVIVNATIRFRGCHQRSSLTPPCRNNFVTLHCYDTNSTRPLNEINNTDNYEPCFGDAMSSRLEDSSGSINAISVIKRFVRPNFKMTYFGIQDNGSYGDVQRILVYYRVAQGYEEGLVRCPTIALPRESTSDTVSKSCTCKENAIPMNNMHLTCRANGVCQGSPMCQCRAGYQGQSDCQACSSGSYSSLDLTNCAPCPQQSTSGMAASNCSCVEGTYRAQSEAVHDSCTSPPSKPRSVTVVPTNVTCAINWVAPSDNGGRSDTFYNITYIEEGSITGSSKPIVASNTNYDIRNLKPVTTYRISITAENGVSANEVSLDQLHERTATVTCTTSEGVPEKPSGVEVIDNLLLIWQKPDTTNGVITGYAVRITFTPPRNSITRDLERTRFYFIFRQSEIPANVTAHVQVRAKTDNHNGKWSNVISFIPSFGRSCPNTCPPIICPPISTPPSCPDLPPAPDVRLMLGGQTYPNNSIFLMTDIGENNKALVCFTDHDQCCQNNRMGEWYYPNNTKVSTSGSGFDFYRNRGAKAVRLNRRNNVLSPTGRYQCRIPDANGVIQILIAYIIQPEGTCPTPPVFECPTCTTPELPTCPTTQPPVTCPECPTCTTPEPTMQSRVTFPECEEHKPLVFQLGGTTYPNNTVVLLEDIGEVDNALLCMSNNTHCCGASSTFRGEFYYPNGTIIPTQAAGHSVYRNREASFIRLNKRGNVVNSPLGRYHCEIIDNTGVKQSLYINIVQNATSCPTVEPDPSCPLPINCDDCTDPPTPQCPPTQGIGFEFGGQRYPNNSVFLMTGIGENSEALVCVTDHKQCCQTPRQGEWYYPNNTAVSISDSGFDFYRNRGPQAIRLNRRNNALSPTGHYLCRIPDGSGAFQTLIADVIAPSPTSIIRVMAVVDDTITVDAPTSILDKIDKFDVQIISEDKRSMRKRQTIKIPSDQLSTLRNNSTYLLKVKPIFKNNTQGEYGPSYTFLFTGATRNTLGSTSTGEGQVDKKFIALAVVLTFLITTIIVTLLVLALVWLFMTCREIRSAKYNGSDKPMKLANFYGNKSDDQ